MAIEVIDAAGLKCPHPIFRIAIKSAEMKKGDILEVIGDCPTFESDVRLWCKKLNRVVLSVRDEKFSQKRIQIQF